MKFETKLLYDTHKRKFCGLLGEPPGPTPPRSPARAEYVDRYGGRKINSPKESLSSPSGKSSHLLNLHSPYNILHVDHDTGQKMSDLEKEKVEELKALKSSKSLQRSYQHLKMKSFPSIVKLSRQSRPSSHEIMDRTEFDDHMKHLRINHHEQLGQLKAHNERLQQEKLEIQERMNSLGLKSRQKLVSQGSMDKQAAEFEGLKKFLDYKSKEISAMKVSYLQGGGRDPLMLSQITQLEQEAQHLQLAPKTVADPVVQQQVMEYHLANQRLEHELQLLRVEKQQNSGLRKTPELSPEFQHLKAQHLEKMTELKHESEVLKQLTEIERMKKELQELRGEKAASPDAGSKQIYETPFLMSKSGMENTLRPSPYDPRCAPMQTLSITAELQANSNDDKRNSHKLFSKGWTKMDLFDGADRLISGRWKIPFRVPPIKTYLSIHELNRIPQVGMSELYIRLVNARDIKQEDIFTPQPLQHYLYKFPPMENPSLYQFSGHRIASLPSTAAATDHPPLPPPSVPPPPDTPGTLSLVSVRSNSSPAADQSILGIQVDQLCDAIDGEVKLKITAYNKLDGEILKAAGDTPVMCVTKSVKQDFLKDTYVFGLQEALFRRVEWNNQSIIIVRVYLQPNSPGTTQAQTANLLEESKLAAWTLVPLAASIVRASRQGRGSAVLLNAGKHCLPLFFPPVPEVTALPTDVTQYPDEWNTYGPATLRMTIFSGFNRPLERPTTPLEFIDENEYPKNAWIKNGRSSMASDEFIPGSGFDLYIDGARFLPDSVTYTKVAGRVMDKTYEKIGPDIEIQSKLYSDIYNPEYDCRLEFREPVFPITSMLVVKLYSVDQISKTLSCIGYSVLSIYLKLGTTNPPLNNSDTEKVALNEGAHQIRIYNGIPDFSQPLGPSLVTKLTPIPCASLLVRIVRAACHPNGRPKEISQFQESEWEKEGLVVPKQSYEQGQYYSLSCEPSLGECQILNSMALRQPMNVRDSIKLTAAGQEKNLKKDDVITSWIKTQLTRSIDAAPSDFDLNYVALYHPMHGIKVSIDGAQNIPWSSFTFATFCLSPPGAFYKGDQADPVAYSTRLVYSSDVSSPIWLDEFKTFPRRLHHRFLVLVIHLREVLVDFSQRLEKYTLKGQAWTVVQIFNEGYVMNGSYQLPLYQGELTEPILNALQQDYCQDVMAAFRRKKTVKYLEGSSVFVRLSDARREEELPKPKTRVKHDYLPKEKLEKYTSVNPSKPLSSLLPPGLAEVDFAYTLPDKLKESFLSRPPASHTFIVIETLPQRPPLHNDHLYTTTTSTQRPPLHNDHLYTMTTSTQRPPLHNVHLYTTTTSTLRPSLHNGHLYTTVTSTQRPPLHNGHLYTTATSTQRPPLHNDHLYTMTTSTQ
ncbi:hypothetical protein QZH41_016209 [Actinostola sp. cb2023]|nr:hypothetical protein QZH41_016209 [Actinostola sp. cb2023]